MLDWSYVDFLIAVKKGDIEKINFFISQGINIQSNNDLAFRVAAESGNITAVKYLISKGANCRIFNDVALINAAYRGHFEVVKYLVNQGASIDLVEDERFKKYITFCNKMELQTRVKAQKKIYFWWIEICYDLNHPSGCGKRMLEKSWMSFDAFQKKLSIIAPDGGRTHDLEVNSLTL